MTKLRFTFQLAALTLVSSLFFACAHQAAQMESPQAPTYTANDWASGDDQAVYVQRFLRDPAAEKSGKYKIIGTCGGFPQINVKTAPGFCVGLVYDGGGVMRKLRWAAGVSATQAVLVDMGGWENQPGSLSMLTFANGKSSLKTLISSENFSKTDPRRGIVNRPNQVSKGPDGKFYVGGATGLYRFDPLAQNPTQSVEVMIDSLPAQGLHPLKSFTFDNRGNVFINVGSSSNSCQNFTQYGSPDETKNPKNFKRRQFSSCPEVEDLKIGQGQIRRYQFKADGRISKDFEVFAKGLRNSVGLIWDPIRDKVLEAENGRDAINKFDSKLSNDEYPHEEINVLESGKHYGWPYCFDQNRNNPEWTNMDCSGYTAPYLLIPAHAAPLGMHIYQGSLFPKWYQGRLLVALHGYEKYGHRLVVFKRDDEGLPTGAPQSVIYDWNKIGEQDKGKPVGISELADGSLLIVEDDPQNKVLRLFYDPLKGDGKPVQEIAEDPRPAPPVKQETNLKERLDKKLQNGTDQPFAQFQSKVIDKTCYECHQTNGAPGVQLVRYDDEGNTKRILAVGKARQLLAMMKGSTEYPSMPPQGWDSAAEQEAAVQLLEKWVKSLK